MTTLPASVGGAKKFGAKLIEMPPPGRPSVTWLAITAVFVIRNVPVARTPPPTKLALLEWITESVTASDPSASTPAAQSDIGRDRGLIDVPVPGPA
jgi:hypothetical protein